MSSSTSSRSGAYRRVSPLRMTVIILAILASCSMVAARIWTDYLWYRSLEAVHVFFVSLWSQAALAGIVFAITALALGINMAIAYRLRPSRPISGRSALIETYQKTLESSMKWIIVATCVLIGGAMGISSMSQSDRFLAWIHATPFNKTDPYFGKDISFFVFDLPWWSFVVSQLLWVMVITFIVTAVVHFLTGALSATPIVIRPPQQMGQPPHVSLSNPLSGRAQGHLSVILGIIMMIFAAGQWLQRYGYAVSDNDPLFTGIGYTDDHSRITAKLIMAAICVICSLILIANAKFKRWIYPASALALAVACALIIQTAYPAIIQQFDVRPNEPNRERPYIAHQIESTRDAFGLSDVEISDYSAKTTVTSGQLIEDASALPGIRLMDPQVIAPTFEQLQQVRGYYSFPEVLDVDRYTIDDQETDAIVAVREVDIDGLPEENRSWNNVHTVYTHGYAMVGAYGNRRQASGEPEWIVRDIPPVGQISQEQPRVYFGENTKHYSIVGATENGQPIELDTPGGNQESGGESYNTYDGSGGVAMKNIVDRALFALRFADVNILLSSRVTNESKILFDRTPMERVSKVAPWLNIDQDPFPAIVDGKVVWIVDGYTTSNTYPNSQRIDLSTATSDSTSDWDPLNSNRTDVNYMRNSVKAVVDAYDGTVSLYAWDPHDPILQTWEKVYPGMLHSVEEISSDLKDHLRYPQDLFKVQRQLLARYHMTDPMAWYQQSDLWRIPDDPRYEKKKEPPYYLSIKWPSDDQAVFSQTAVFVPNERENLGAYMAVVADASHKDYGKIRVLRLSDTHQVPGPNQTFNAIQTDQRVQQALLPFTSQGAAEPVYGNLLTLPLGGGLIYVEPIYTQGKKDASYPVLRFIVVRFGDHIGIGDTLQEALDMVFEGDAGVSTGEENSSGVAAQNKDDSPAQVLKGSQAAQEELKAAAQAFEAADQALKSSDLASYQSKINEAKEHLKRADEALR